MAVTTTQTNKPFNPRGNDQSPKGFNRAKLYSGKALDFDGVNDTLSTDYAPSSNIQTTAYWVKLDSLTTDYSLGGFVNGTTDAFILFYWGGQSDKYFGFNTWNNDSYGIILPDFVDDWFHIVAEYNFSDFTQSKIFVNGQELNISQTKATSVQRTTANRTFDINTPTGSFLTNGKINGVKVFNTALTAAQVADLYNNPEKVVPTGVDNTALKLWLPMQEGAGTTAYDGSGNGNHGTISGATYVHGIGAPVSQTAVIDWNKGVNLLSRSENAEHVNWGKYFLTATDGETDPLGTSRAFEITENTGLQSRNLRSSDFSAVSGTQYYFSIIAKQGSGSRYLGFAGAGIAGASEAPVFDLQNGSVDLGASSVLVKSASIEAYGNDGWYKCSMVYEADATTTYQIWLTMCQNATDNGTGNYSYVGNGTSSIFLFAPILKVGSAEGVYVQTIATTQPNDVLLPQGLTTGRDITGVNLFENVRKQGALNLDGNSWAEVHDNASLDVSDEVTLEAWVYAEADSLNKGILGKWDFGGAKMSYLLIRSGDGSLRFYTSATGSITTYAATTTTIINGNWYHIVGTDNGTNLTIYLNGGVETTSASFGSIYESNKDLEVGRHGYQTGYNTNGQLAQPRIYNRALTAEEVQRNYNAGKNIYK